MENMPEGTATSRGGPTHRAWYIQKTGRIQLLCKHRTVEALGINNKGYEFKSMEERVTCLKCMKIPRRKE